jgi:5-formyltetrahydrofolate cyclo-ligase
VVEKSRLRKKILKIRENQNKDKFRINFKLILEIIKKENIKKKSIGGYYPINFEVDDLDILKELETKNFSISLPIIKKNFSMNFYKWSINEPLRINRYGIPEPISKKINYPEILLIPLVAFDGNLNRLGYGGGYYDRYLEKMNRKKKILKIGLAFHFQKIKKVPINDYDKKLDYIITNKSIIITNKSIIK